MMPMMMGGESLVKARQSYIASGQRRDIHRYAYSVHSVVTLPPTELAKHTEPEKHQTLTETDSGTECSASNCLYSSSERQNSSDPNTYHQAHTERKRKISCLPERNRP